MSPFRGRPTISDDKVGSFLQCLVEAPTLWRAADVRVVAVRAAGTWFNLLSRCRLTSRPVHQVPRVRHWPITANLVAFQGILPVDRVPDLIRAIAAGVYRAKDRRIVFETPPDANGKGGARYNNSFFAPASQGYPRRDDDFPIAHELTLSGGSAQLLYQGIPDGRDGLDQMLRSLASPWDGVAALARDGLGLDAADQSTPLRIQFLAPLEVGFDKRASSLSRDGTLRFRVRAVTPPVGRTSVVGYTGTTADRTPLAASLPLVKKKWPSDNGRAACDVKQRIAGAVRLTLLLRLGTHVVDRAQITGPSVRGNPRLSSYGTVDRELRRLREALFNSDGTKSKEFERAVSKLFVLAGLAVDMLADDPKAGQAADALVFDDSTSNVLVVECTTGPLNQDGKMARLKKRTADIQEALQSLGRLQARAVLVCSLQGDRLSTAELDAASRDRMAVLSREDLETILQLALDGEPPDLVLALVLDRVPRRGMSGLIGHWGLR